MLSKPTQARSIATYEAIVTRAALLFAQQGYDATRFKDILADGRISQGALYYHFKSKEEVALEVIKRQHAISSRAGTQMIMSNLTGILAIVTLSRVLAEQIRTDPIVAAGLRLSTESAHSFSEPVTSPYADWEQMTEKFIFQAISEGTVDKTSNTQGLARAVIAIFTGAQIVSAARTNSEDLPELLERVWSIAIPGIVVADHVERIVAGVHEAIYSDDHAR